MGIYPSAPEITDLVRNEDGSEDWTETYKPMDGSIQVRRIHAAPAEVTWEDCFCCTCNSGWDPSCRNHGAWGRRPCEDHGTRGQRDEDGEMPASVQEARRA